MSKVTINVNRLSLVHENSGGVSTATLPDVCSTPLEGAVPYPNVALSRDLTGGSSAIRADGGHRIAVAGSRFARSAGGEPGTLGGVTSGSSSAEATWISHSFDVAIEGRGACRLTDKMLHNRANTIDCGGVVQEPVGQPFALERRAPKKKPGAATGKKHTHASGASSRFGIDTNLGDPPMVGDPPRPGKRHGLDTDYAKKRHCTFVGRYLSVDPGNHPRLTAREVHRLKKAGLDVFAIWELTKYRAIELGSIAAQEQAGHDDAFDAHDRIEKVGGHGRPVYFTVDFGVSAEDWHSPVLSCDQLAPYVAAGTSPTVKTKDLVLAYFRGVNSVLHPRRVGAYGTYWTIRKLFNSGKIKYGWQMTFSPKGHPEKQPRIEHRAQLHQIGIYPDQRVMKNGRGRWGVVGAGALDYDRAVQADFGQW